MIDGRYQHHADAMAHEAGGSIVVGTRSDSARSEDAMVWSTYRRGDRAVHHLRTCMAHEIVFDLGDHGDWMRCVQETHALWLALNRMGIHYWGALSGGKGTHTHIFGPRGGDNSWRNAASGAILDIAGAMLAAITNSPFEEVAADPRLLSPQPNTRMCREFGQRKSPSSAERKLMWTTGGPFLPLPPKRETAYGVAEAGRIYPPALIRQPSLAALDRSWHKDVGIEGCPRGPQCVPSSTNPSDDWYRRCADCPSKEEY